VMIHRALLGSLDASSPSSSSIPAERSLLWLAPVQVAC